LGINGENKKYEVFGWGFKVFFFFGKLPKKKRFYPPGVLEKSL